jgi:hypothetical protein
MAQLHFVHWFVLYNSKEFIYCDNFDQDNKNDRTIKANPAELSTKQAALSIDVTKSERNDTEKGFTLRDFGISKTISLIKGVAVCNTHDK